MVYRAREGSLTQKVKSLTTHVLILTLEFRIQRPFESIYFNTLFLQMKKWRPIEAGDWPRGIQ